MSGTVWKGSPKDILRNFILTLRLVIWILTSSWAQTTLKLRRWVSCSFAQCDTGTTTCAYLSTQTLGFKWLSIGADSNITPPPAAVKEVTAAISCNVENLHFYQQ